MRYTLIFLLWSNLVFTQEIIKIDSAILIPRLFELERTMFRASDTLYFTAAGVSFSLSDLNNYIEIFKKMKEFISEANFLEFCKMESNKKDWLATKLKIDTVNLIFIPSRKVDDYFHVSDSILEYHKIRLPHLHSFFSPLLFSVKINDLTRIYAITCTTTSSSYRKCTKFGYLGSFILYELENNEWIKRANLYSWYV